MGAFFSQFWMQAYSLTLRGLSTEIGVQAWAKRVADLAGSLMSFLAVYLSRQWQRLIYQEFRLQGEDALLILRWVQEQPAARIASSFTVAKDIAVQLREDAPPLDNAAGLERSLEFKPNLESGVLRLAVSGTYAWFHTSFREQQRLHRTARRMPTGSSGDSSSARRAKGNVRRSAGPSDATVSAIAGFEGLNAWTIADLAREEEDREKAFVAIRILNVPWQRHMSAKSLVVRPVRATEYEQMRLHTQCCIIFLVAAFATTAAAAAGGGGGGGCGGGDSVPAAAAAAAHSLLLVD
jgi:hypothetical protein